MDGTMKAAATAWETANDLGKVADAALDVAQDTSQVRDERHLAVLTSIAASLRELVYLERAK